MAYVKTYYGGMGPFLHDPTDALIDPDGDFPGVDSHGLVTDGQLVVEAAPTQDDHVVRNVDLSDMAIKLESQSYFFARIY